MPRIDRTSENITASVTINRQLYNRCLEKSGGNFTLLVEMAMAAYLDEILEAEVKMQALFNTKKKLQEEGFAELKRNQAAKEQQKLDVWSKVELENQHKEAIAAAVCAVLNEKNRQKLSALKARGSEDLYRNLSVIVRNIQPQFPEDDENYLSNFIIDLISNNWNPKLKEIPAEYYAAKQEQTA